MIASTARILTGPEPRRTAVSRNLRIWLWLALGLAGVLPAARADNTVLHLKNGDRIAGKIISEDTNRVLITTSWITELAVPTREIERREPSTPPPIISGSVAKSFVTPKAIPTTPPQSKSWKIEARAGADFLSGPKNQQIYYGRLKHSYARPYISNPIQSFRNVLDFAVDYGLTQTTSSSGEETSVLSANRMSLSDKTGFDIGKGRWFVYDLASVGYDEIRKVDFKYAVGPGLGYHLITRPSYQLNVELGVDYQVQHRSDNTTTRNLFFRIGQDSTWKLAPDLTFTERLEFSQRADSANFRARAESTLSYALWRNLSLHLSMLDLYDTAPAQRVTHNDLQVHTSIGVTF